MANRWKFVASIAVAFSLLLLTAACEPAPKTIRVQEVVKTTRLGERLSIYGTVWPAVAGLRMTLERWEGSEWVLKAVGRTGKEGTVFFQPRWEAGVHSVQVRAAGLFAQTRVEVIEDRTAYLDTYVMKDPSDWGSRTIGTIEYPRSFSSDACSFGTHSLYWNIHGFYRRLTVVVGLSAGSDPVAEATYRIKGGSRVVISGSVKPGRPHYVDVDITDVHDLGLEWSRPDCGSLRSDGEIVFGTPMVYR